MRVKVLPPHGCDRSALDERCWMELPEGAIAVLFVIFLIIFHCDCDLITAPNPTQII